jgi:hypothetical protein
MGKEQFFLITFYRGKWIIASELTESYEEAFAWYERIGKDKLAFQISKTIYG